MDYGFLDAKISSSVETISATAPASIMEWDEQRLSLSSDTLVDDCSRGAIERRSLAMTDVGENVVIPTLRQDGTSPFHEFTLRFGQHQGYGELSENVNNTQRFRVRDLRTVDTVGPEYQSWCEDKVESRRSLHHFSARRDELNENDVASVMTNLFVLAEFRPTAEGEFSFNRPS